MVSKDEAKVEIKKLVQRFLKDKAIYEDKSETDIRIQLIDPLFESLGWDMAGKVIPDEVFRETSIPKKESSRKKADYTFKIGVTKLVVEAKSLKECLDEKVYIEQVIGYAYNIPCAWAVLTNFATVKIFCVIEDTYSPFYKIDLTNIHDFDDNFEMLWFISKNGIMENLLDNEAKRRGIRNERTPIDKQLFENLKDWRDKLSKEIRDRRKDLNEDEIDEAVQRIIDRLIFIRKVEDLEYKDRKLEQIAKTSENAYEDVKKLFADFNKNYNSKLFGENEKDKALCDEIEISNNTIVSVIWQMYRPARGKPEYNFAVIDADILGNIYEQYLSYILQKTPKGSKLKGGISHRKEQGIYYTPTYIVDYIVKSTLGELLKDKKTKAEKIKVLDLACGSGSFLIKAFDELNKYYIKKDGKGHQTKLDSNGVLYTRKVKILAENIFGVDLDPKAVEIAQLNLLLKIAQKGERLPTLRNNIKVGNSLIDDGNVSNKPLKWKGEFSDIMNEGGFDVIIGNPPYVKLQTLDKNQIKYFYSNYKSATKHYDIYALFVERALSLLKDGGLLGFILPSKFFTTDYGMGLRKIIAENKSIMKIINLNDYQVFDKATTYTCLLFLKKSRNKTFDYYEICNKNKLAETKVISNDIFKHSMQKQPNGGDLWNFSSDDIDKLMNKLKEIRLKLSDVSEDIFQGVLTGRDKIYFVNIVEDMGKCVKVRNNYDDKEYIIEKALLKKLLKGKEIHRWQIYWKNSFVLYPYKTKDGVTKLIPIDEMKANYPKTYQYLFTYKKELMTSETSEAVDESNWYRFRRPRSLDQFENCKIITQVLSSKSSFALDEKGEFYFVGGGNAGGFGIIVKNQYAKHYYVILALLNSRLLEFYLKRISTPFRGGFYSYGKKFIEKLPIIMPTGDDMKMLDELSRSQLKRVFILGQIGDKKTDEKRKIEDEIKKTDSDIDNIIYKIYHVGENEINIINESLK